jgi:hypothetical protein
MVLRLQNISSIENLGRCSAESMEQIRALLSSGAIARADERRKGFYEVQSGDDLFWVHVSPVSGRVALLAAWKQDQMNRNVASPARARRAA